MLEELKNIEFQGGKEELLFFLCDVIGDNKRNIKDAYTLCMYAPGKHYLSLNSLIRYCSAFNWIHKLEGVLSLSEGILSVYSDKEKLNNILVINTVEQLFNNGIFAANMFSYDAVQCVYCFKSELLPLSLSTIRNMLISQGFFFILRNVQETKFYVSPKYDTLVAKYCKTQRKLLSLEQLKKQLENNEIAGEKAELFVLEYEKKRLGNPKNSLVKRISEIDVSAGYDIVSFNSECSEIPDRYIEVKAVSTSGFYWSKNEYEVAKLFGEKYFIYLVSLSHIDDEGYVPEIIINPAVTIMNNGDWIVEPQSYHISKPI